MNRREFLGAALAVAASVTVSPTASDAAGSVTATHVKGISVISISGKCTIGECDIALRETLHGELNAGYKNIILNLCNVTRMDSSALGELVSCYTTVKNRMGRLVLAAPSAHVQKILEITRLISVFTIYSSMDEALASFTTTD